MNRLPKAFPKNRKRVFAVMILLFVLGSVLAIQTAGWSHDAIIAEHDKHICQLAGTVDHNIYAVLGRCRTELHDLVASDSLRKAEQAAVAGEDTGALKEILQKSAVLLMDYATCIIVQRDDRILLSTAADGTLDYTVIMENDGDDMFLCTENESGKSYVALSSASEISGYTYFVLLDLELFFRRVVTDTVYEDYWIVLYDPESGLSVQNDNSQPEYKIFSEQELVDRNDGYTIIRERDQAGDIGTSAYRYTDSGVEKTVRIYVIPSSDSENGVVAVAVADYNENIAVPARKITLGFILAAVLVAFSAATAIFMFLHNGRRERELADEIASLEKERQLKEEILQQREQVIHHQKLETIGTLTAGIAHQFNNLLAPIMGNSMLILEKSRQADPEIFDNALEIYEASTRSKELVANIAKLSRKPVAGTMKPVRPAKLITDVLSMGAASVPGNITVHKVIRTEKQFLGDEGQLGHMLLNLVINAVQAMTPDGGTLTVIADDEADFVRIILADTGKGIPEENLEVIFDPFFTTKEVGKGTGLGLPIAQRIAVDHGGRIRGRNLPGGGAEFTFMIPALPDNR